MGWVGRRKGKLLLDPGKSLTIEHDGRRLGDLAHVARLLPELADSCLLGRLAVVDQAGGDLDDDLVYGGPVLLLQNKLRS